MFIYPDNLKAKATLWLWELRDVAIIGVGFLFSVLAIAQTGILLPLVVTVLYAFLSIRLEGSSSRSPWKRTRQRHTGPRS